MLHQKHESYKFVLPLKNWAANHYVTKKCHNLKSEYFEKKYPKTKKKNFFPVYNFALKIKTSLAKKIVKPILETWNAKHVIVYVLFIRFQTKKILPTCNVNKNNSKCGKFTIKTKIIQIESKISSTT